MTYYICNECCQEVAGPDSICRCQEIKALKEEVTTLRTRAESAERERDELTKRMKFEVIREIKHGRTAVNFGHIPAVSRALDWLCSDITHMDLPIKERP